MVGLFIEAPGAARPPLHLWVLRAALLATLLAGSSLGAFNLFLIDGALGVVPETWIQVHAQIQLLAFAALLVVGVGSFVVPRFWEAPAPRRWAIRVAAAGLLGSVVLLSAGLLLSRPAPVIASGIAVLGGSSVFFGLIVALYRRRQRSRPGLDRFLLTGSAWLVVAAAMQALNAVRTGLGGKPALAAWLTEPTYAALLFGFLGSWLVGVGLRVVVGPDPRRAGWLFFIWQAGVLLLVLASLLPLAPARAEGSRALARLALGIASIAIAAEPGLVRRRFPTSELIGERRRDRVQRAAWAFFALQGLLLIWAGLEPLRGRSPHAFLLDAARHTYALGFLALMALVMGSRIFPRLGGRALGRPWLLDVACALLSAGVLARLLQIPAAMGMPGLLPLVGWSGIAALAGLVVGFGMLLASLPGARSGGANEA